jgi:hypothetical protein
MLHLACALLAIGVLSISRFYSRGVLVVGCRHCRVLHANGRRERADEGTEAAKRSIDHEPNIYRWSFMSREIKEQELFA